MHTPTVSVIIPVFNRERTLRRAVLSVQAQTFDDWEMIIIDDGSSDGSAKLAEELASADSRIRALRLARNSGANAARNAGVRISSGRWLALLDSDDEWLPQRLELQLKRADEWKNEFGEEPGIVYGGIDIRFTDGRRLLRDEGPEGMVFSKLLTQFFGFTTTLMIRRAVWEHLGGFGDRYRLCDEFEFSLRAAQEFSYARVPGIVAIAHCQHDSKHHPNGHVLLMKRHKHDILRLHGRRGLGGVYFNNALRYWAVKEFGPALFWLARCLLIAPRSRPAWRFLLSLPRAKARHMLSRH